MTDARVSNRMSGSRTALTSVLLLVGAGVAMVLGSGTVVLGCLSMFAPSLDGPDPIGLLHNFLAVAAAWFAMALAGCLGAVAVVRWPRGTACVVGAVLLTAAVLVAAIGLRAGGERPLVGLLFVWALAATPLAIASLTAVRRAIR